jgi:hypothetical protein
MRQPFEFDQNKTAQENITDFLTHVDSIDSAFGGLLRRNIGTMLPLPEVAKRGVARAAFNGEIKRQLDLALAAMKGKNG